MAETVSCRRPAATRIFAALAAAACLLALFGGIGARQAYAADAGNISFSVPAKVPFAVKADGTTVGPSAAAWRIKNTGARSLRISGVGATGFSDGSAVSAVSEAMPVADTSSRGIWSVNAGRGGASLASSTDGTIEIPVGGSAGFTWSADLADGTKHAAGPAPSSLGTVSFTLGGADRVAFAVYSADDQSLNFYKRFDVPEAGDTFEGKAVTEVYTGFETEAHGVKWKEISSDIKTVTVVDAGIAPMTTGQWFERCKNLVSVDLAKLDTSRVSLMTGMFYGCSELASLDVSGWNVSNVTDMGYMFDGCSSLASLDLSGWSTSSATEMRCMFRDCRGLTTVGDLSGWDVSHVTDMSYMFNTCSSLASLDLSGWDISSCTTMYAMFLGRSQLTSLDLSGWDMSKVEQVPEMPDSLTSLKADGLVLPADCSYMLSGCSSLTSLDLSSWDVSHVTGMGFMFSDCSGLTTVGDLSGWDVSHVTDMSLMFCRCYDLVADCSNWDVSSVTENDYFNDEAPGVIEPNWNI